MGEYLVSDIVKVSHFFDDFRLGSNLKINQTLIFPKVSFFYTILGIIQSHSGSLVDIDGCFQLIPGTYKSEKPIEITGIDEVHLKCDSINGSTLNGVREPILYSFELDKPLGHKIYRESRLKLLKKINQFSLI